ncbi:MAG: hypothetical protein NVS4B3_25710 [Gemmatimonadaceae bacterium]
MGMYRLTITGEWDTGADDLPVGRAACEFAAENSVEAFDAARALLAALLGNRDEQPEYASPPPRWEASEGSAATLMGALVVEVRYLEPHDRAPVDLHWVAD